jgi:replicative DNA helicase
MSPIEHERALLAAVLHEPGIIDSVALKPELFQEPAMRAVFDAVCAVRDKGLNVDEITIADELKAAGRQGYIAFMAGIEHFTASNASYYVDKLREAARLRALEPVLRDGLAKIGAGQPAREIVDELERGLSGAIRLAPEAEDVSAAALLPAYLYELEHRAQERAEGRGDEIDMGLPSLDAILGPVRPGEMVVVAARPGAGKTAMGLGTAAHVAVDMGVSTAVFSLEMSRQEVLDRLISGRSRFTLGRLRGGNIGTSDYTDLIKAGEPFRAAPLAIYDGPHGLGLLRSRIRRESAVRGLRFAVVDYLGLLDLGAGGSIPRWERVGEASRTLKLLALELGLTVLLCVQLNREADGREPSLGQLRDSGAIEQDADRVVLLHCHDENGAEDRRISAIVAKNRHGSTGRAELTFNGPHARFSSGARI